MALNYSRMAMVGLDNPAIRKDVGRWLDQTKGVPQDATQNKMYYEGVMGNTPLYILSGLSHMPNGVPKTGGGCYDTATCMRISVAFKHQPYDIIFEMTNAKLGENKAIHDGRLVNAYMGWATIAVITTTLNATNGASMVEQLWSLI